MNTLKYDNWKVFQIGDLFNVIKGSRLRKQDIKQGDINYVSASSFNNGITNHIGNLEHVHQGNALTVTYDGSDIGRTFYQEKKFWATDSVNVLQPLFPMNKHIALFFAPLIKAAGINYIYKNKWKQEDMKRAKIKLPVDKNGKPDWFFIETYMKEIEEKASSRIQKIILLYSGTSQKIDVSTWKDFKLDSLFEIIKGSRLRKQDMKEGDYNYIGASSFNNGITNRIGNDAKIHPAKTITVSYNGSVGQAFYQSSPFWASDDVNVFYPKFRATKNILMFFLPLIKSVGKNFEFVDKWKLEEMKSAIIKLPVDSFGNPDWLYMEQYMNNMEHIAKKRLEAFVFE